MRSKVGGAAIHIGWGTSQGILDLAAGMRQCGAWARIASVVNQHNHTTLGGKL